MPMMKLLILEFDNSKEKSLNDTLFFLETQKLVHSTSINHDKHSFAVEVTLKTNYNDSIF